MGRVEAEAYCSRIGPPYRAGAGATEEARRESVFNSVTLSVDVGAAADRAVCRIALRAISGSSRATGS